MFRDYLRNKVFALYHRNEPEYLEWYAGHRAKLLPFRGRHAGEKCFIIGNGPSLNRMDLGQLRGCCCFGLNKIHILTEKKALDIAYHVAVNELVIQQSAANIESLACPTFLSYAAAKGVVRNLPHVHYLCTGGPYTFRPSIDDKIHEGYTVTFVAMQIAFFMGFEEVYLIGVDHNFVASGKPNEKQLHEGADVNHFDASYFSDKEWHLPDLESSELSYRIADYYYRRSGRRIYDATLDGKLQVFPKISFEEALARCR